ncbi:SPOC like C-terminal domain-containing protein [Gorgonomyces haynaldii]|nr:SPOC like C-terminal domain-containing protein [Gorgonomyces haynaldii]
MDPAILEDASETFNWMVGFQLLHKNKSDYNKVVLVSDPPLELELTPTVFQHLRTCKSGSVSECVLDQIQKMASHCKDNKYKKSLHVFCESKLWMDGHPIRELCQSNDIALDVVEYHGLSDNSQLLKTAQGPHLKSIQPVPTFKGQLVIDSVSIQVSAYSKTLEAKKLPLKTLKPTATDPVDGQEDSEIMSEDQTSNPEGTTVDEHPQLEGVPVQMIKAGNLFLPARNIDLAFEDEIRVLGFVGQSQIPRSHLMSHILCVGSKDDAFASQKISALSYAMDLQRSCAIVRYTKKQSIKLGVLYPNTDGTLYFVQLPFEHELCFNRFIGSFISPSPSVQPINVQPSSVHSASEQHVSEPLTETMDEAGIAKMTDYLNAMTLTEIPESCNPSIYNQQRNIIQRLIDPERPVLEMKTIRPMYSQQALEIVESILQTTHQNKANSLASVESSAQKRDAVELLHSVEQVMQPEAIVQSVQQTLDVAESLQRAVEMVEAVEETMEMVEKPAEMTKTLEETMEIVESVESTAETLKQSTSSVDSTEFVHVLSPLQELVQSGDPESIKQGS